MVISIEDTETGNLIDLKTDSIYSFTANSTGDPQRFIIYFDGTTLGINKPNIVNKDDIKVYVDSKGRVNIKNLKDNPINGVFKIYDILGLEKESLKLNGKSWQQFNVNLNEGVYIIEILGNERITSQKVIIK